MRHGAGHSETTNLDVEACIISPSSIRLYMCHISSDCCGVRATVLQRILYLVEDIHRFEGRSLDRMDQHVGTCAASPQLCGKLSNPPPDPRHLTETGLARFSLFYRRGDAEMPFENGARLRFHRGEAREPLCFSRRSGTPRRTTHSSRRLEKSYGVRM